MSPPPTVIVKAGQTVRFNTDADTLAVVFTIHAHGILQFRASPPGRPDNPLATTTAVTDARTAPDRHGAEARPADWGDAGTPWADGTGKISNCYITPGSKRLVYEFEAPFHVGTYLYHGHVNHVKVSGFTGLLIVEVRVSPLASPERAPPLSLLLTDALTHTQPNEAPPNGAPPVEWPPTYVFDEAIELTVADTYQVPKLGLLQEALSTHQFMWPGEPQSILVNGKSWTNCTQYSSALRTCTAAGGDVSDGESEASAPGLLSQDCESSISAVLKSQNGVSVESIGTNSAIRFFNTLALCYPNTCPGRAEVPVVSGTTYLVRVGNTGVMSTINIVIEVRGAVLPTSTSARARLPRADLTRPARSSRARQDHNFTVVEFDARPIVPIVQDHLTLSQGQRAVRAVGEGGGRRARAR